jgi:hypothetical protein
MIEINKRLYLDAGTMQKSGEYIATKRLCRLMMEQVARDGKDEIAYRDGMMKKEK